MFNEEQEGDEVWTLDDLLSEACSWVERFSSGLLGLANYIHDAYPHSHSASRLLRESRTLSEWCRDCLREYTQNGQNGLRTLLSVFYVPQNMLRTLYQDILVLTAEERLKRRRIKRWTRASILTTDENETALKQCQRWIENTSDTVNWVRRQLGLTYVV
jgi:hypothetical protein